MQITVLTIKYARFCGEQKTRLQQSCPSNLLTLRKGLPREVLVRTHSFHMQGFEADDCLGETSNDHPHEDCQLIKHEDGRCSESHSNGVTPRLSAD
jgi:hypothetical protein